MYKVAVIGCGAIGLTTAIEIQKVLSPNAQIVIITRNKSPETTSDVAAGLWTPYGLERTPLAKVYGWSRSTYDFLLDLWTRGEAKEAGISLQPVIRLTCLPNYEMPDWLDLTLGYYEIPQEKLAEIGVEMREKFTAGVAYVTFIWEPAIFLPYLERKFIQDGGRIQIKTVVRLCELSSDYDVIVNCTGLAARDLVGDPASHPIRGQIIRVQSPWQHDALMFDTRYIIPNRESVVLGGTLQLDNDDTRVNVTDRDAILKACAQYVPALHSAAIVANRVGLRPGRHEIRLEVEEQGKIVHNYGHGGSGITLAVGCAKETAQLTKAALERKLRHKL